MSKVLIPLAPGFEEIEAVTIIDLLRRAEVDVTITGLENGLAVPHAKTAGANELLVSFGLIRQGLDFDSLDGKPANFIFLVLSPRDTSGPHIKALAQIARNFREVEIGRKVMNAKDKNEILQIIRTFK